MKFKELKKSLSERIENVYILSCKNDEEDLYLKNSAIANITKKAVTSFEELNISVFGEENSDAERIKKALETLPFMSEKRLVLIKECENVKYDNILEILSNYIDSPNGSTVLVVDEKEGTKLSLLEKKENVVVVDCSRLDRDILYSYIAKTCEKEGVKIDPASINKIIDYTNSYMQKIDLEIHKLISYKFDTKEIQVKDIEDLVEKSDEYQIFELTNSLFNKNAERALYIVDDIIRNKRNVSSILSLIFAHIRRLFYIKVTKEKDEDIAKKLEIKEYAVKMMRTVADRISAKKLKETLILCKDIDYNVKSGKLDLISGIYNLIFAILV